MGSIEKTLLKWLRRCKHYKECSTLCEDCIIKRRLDIHSKRLAKSRGIEQEEVIKEYDIWQIDINTIL